MNTVEELEGYLALVEMWENSYCPEGIDQIGRASCRERV